MKALYIRQHGPIGDLRVSDVPVPAPKPGEVLVKVEAAGINPSDLVSVQGRFPHAVLPRTVGRDFAGTVVEGPPELAGKKVWGSGGDLGVIRDGTHVEYLAIPQAATAQRPANLSAEEAAAVGVPFVTAYSALITLGGLQQGEWVIVSGAAGAVGQAAVQIAHARGAHVIALLKSATETHASGFAVTEAVATSEKGDLEAVVRQATNGRGADLALNGVGSSIMGAILASLAEGGRQVIYSVLGGQEFKLDLFGFYRNQFKLFGLNTVKLDASACGAILNELAPLFESGALRPPAIGESYPLADAAKAYQRVAAHAGGKVVLTIS
ncbi:MAG TPA: zinc-binding alcohol dehydrogenase family protein [Candidatus Bathyarchaeia archaeon]|nr:zinc-binding alcohol dehydrogenase family protein [Candidatus Bathyarchaeia archaeon]